VAKVGTSKAGGTISQQAVVHPWLAADAHGNKQTMGNTNKALGKTRRTRKDNIKMDLKQDEDEN
jgi:hypothetical protein